MWKPEHRRAALRKGLRYPNNLIDEEWALIASLIPAAKRGGRGREIDVREVLNAIFYVLSTGCQSDRAHHRQPECQSRSKRGKNLDPQGFDAGKKVKGRKRHILVDTLGLLLNVVVHTADIQDRDGAALVLDKRTRGLFAFIERIYAKGFVVLPK